MKVLPGGWRTVVLLLFAGAFSALSQTEVLVVPGQYSNSVANTSDNAPLAAANQHIQQDYAGSLLATAGLTAGEQITAIGFSVVSGESGLPAQTVSDYSIWMGVAVSPGNMSTTLADNGSSMTLVRSGALTITNGQFVGGPNMNPFGMIQLSLPYTYTGGNLLIEIAYDGFASGADVEAAYPYDSSMAETAFGSGPDSTTADQGLYDEALVMAFNINMAPANLAAIPEPTVLALFIGGTVGLFFVSRNRNRR